MTNKGKLILIPNIIADNTQENVVTPQLGHLLPDIRYFLAENIRTARRFLSSLKVFPSIEALDFKVLDKNTDEASIGALLTPLKDGFDVGIISESGCPGVADPGALAVAYAHAHEIKVIPLVGPSAILMALMASGLNGQKFAFQGYLPIDSSEIITAIKGFEKESKMKSQTQIFIETPYRNNAVFHALIKNLQPDTRLTLALDITGSGEIIKTLMVKEWRRNPPMLPKLPAVFLFLQ